MNLELGASNLMSRHKKKKKKNFNCALNLTLGTTFINNFNIRTQIYCQFKNWGIKFDLYFKIGAPNYAYILTVGHQIYQEFKNWGIKFNVIFTFF